MVNPKIRKGPQGGRFQRVKVGDRYLLEEKKVRTGPEGGLYQTYGKSNKKKRYLLHKH